MLFQQKTQNLFQDSENSELNSQLQHNQLNLDQEKKIRFQRKQRNRAQFKSSNTSDHSRKLSLINAQKARLQKDGTRKALNFDQVDQITGENDQIEIEEKPSPMEILYCPEQLLPRQQENMLVEETERKCLITATRNQEAAAANPSKIAECKYQKDMIYCPRQLQNMKSQEDEFSPRDFLQNHKINPTTRAKMVDWLIEVLGSYKCCEQTWFLTVNIMDRFFQNSQKQQEVQDLHLIGVTCLFIANKYEEIYPIRLQTIFSKISHQKLSMEDIKKKELEVLSTLDFNLTGPTVYDFITCGLFLIDIKSQLSEKHLQLFQKIIVYITKMVLFEYDITSKKNSTLLAAGIIYVSFKILEQIGKNLSIPENMQKIKALLEVEESSLIETATQILWLAKNYDSIYGNLANLKKYHSSLFDELEQEQRNAQN